MPPTSLDHDTHGLLRPECITHWLGVELILHAGDVGGREIIAELSLIAPVQLWPATVTTPGPAVSRWRWTRFRNVRVQ